MPVRLGELLAKFSPFVRHRTAGSLCVRADSKIDNLSRRSNAVIIDSYIVVAGTVRSGSRQPFLLLHCLCVNVQAQNMHKNGDMEQAERLYQRAIDQDSTNADAHHLLGALLVQRHGTDQVRSHRLLRRSMPEMQTISQPP